MLLGRIREDPLMGHSSESLSAAFISGAMLSRERTSLNAIAYASTARLIRAALDRGVNLVEAYIDTVGDADRYKVWVITGCWGRGCRSLPQMQVWVCSCHRRA